MPFNRLVAITTMLLFGATGAAFGADEPAPPKLEPKAPAAADKSTKKKLFGNGNMLYLDFAGGVGGAKAVESSITTGALSISTDHFKIDKAYGGRFSVGWTLPEGRGRYLLSLSGFGEQSYTYSSEALTNQVISLQGSPTQNAPLLLWWTSSVKNGVLVSTKTNPLWDDLNTNGIVDAGEVSYASTPDAQTSKAVTDTMQNRLNIWDLVYQRDFGGRRVGLTWTAGGRYYFYTGNIPASAWLTSGSAQSGAGYSDGVVLPFIVTNQDTTGLGPTGSAELQVRFSRGKVVLFGRGEVAFCLQTSKIATGPFFTLVRDTSSGNLIAATAELSKKLDSSVWHLGATFGARFVVAEGCNIEVAWGTRALQSAILVPQSLLIPDRSDRIEVGTSALYQTRDLRYQMATVGLSYQF